MFNTKLIAGVLAALLILTAAALSSCNGGISVADPTVTETPAETTAGTEAVQPTENVSTATPAGTASGDPAQPTASEPVTGTEPTEPTEQPGQVYEIVFKDGSADVGSSGAKLEGGKVTISKAGTYEVSGSSSNGQIVVVVEKTEEVELIFDNLSLTNPTGPAVYCDSADKLTITVKSGTVNTLSDGKSYTDLEGPNAALYSDDDLTLRGSGTLNVIGVYNNGVSSKNDIKIEDLTLNVDANNTGIRGKASVTVFSGTVSVKAKNDGIKATETTKEGKGFVEISGGTVVVNAYDDGIKAETFITLSGGKVTITALDKKLAAPEQNVTPGVLQN